MLKILCALCFAGVYSQYLVNKNKHCDERVSDVFSKLKFLETKIDLYREENMELKAEIEKLSTYLNKTKDDAPFDCWDLSQRGFNRSGIYPIYPWGSKEKSVYVHCNMEVAPPGWTMVQHRKTLTVNFTRGWKDYKNGFGTNAEFWLGNEIVHLLTSRHHNQLYIGIIDTNGSYLYQKYHFIRVGPESDKYRLHIEGPTTGDAGNKVFRDAGDFILRYNNSKSINNQRFTTFDNDNDNNAGNCATGTGGWWYNSCHYVALNNDPDSPETVYQDRVPNMSHFRFSSMMINRAP